MEANSVKKITSEFGGVMGSILNNMREGFAILQLIFDENDRPADWVVIEFNSAFEQLSGMKREDIPGRSAKVHMPEIQSVLLERYGKVARTGEKDSFEFYRRSINHWFEVQAYSLHEDHKIVIIFTDITQRKEQEQKFNAERNAYLQEIKLLEEAQRILRKKEETDRHSLMSINEILPMIDMTDDSGIRRLKTILDLLPSSVVLVRASDDTISYINRRGLELYGYDDVWIDLKTEKITVLQPDGTPFPQEEWPVNLSLRLGETVHNREMLIQNMHGNLLPVLVSSAPIHGNAGDIIAAIVTLEDISERKRAENALQEQAKQLAQQARELSQKNGLITDFFINISHEFKTPLSILMIGIDLLEKKAAIGADLTKNIAVMRQNSLRLGRLVANLLDITKLDAGFMEPQWETKNIVEWLGSLVKSTELYAKQKKLKLSFSHSANEKIMFTDGFILDRIMLNLISNAIKHTPSGGRIDVYCQVSADKITVSVRDTGEGIPEDRKGIIFDRFRQVNTALARTSEGCGIGLALTKSLVELLHGRIWFTSTLGRGSEFLFELPVLQVEMWRKPIDQNGLHLDRRVQMELSDIDLV